MPALAAWIEVVRQATGRVVAERDVRVRVRGPLHVVELGGDMVAFAAADEPARRRLAMERRVLARLGPRLSFEVPRPLGPIERVEPCDVRTRTRGDVGKVYAAHVRTDPDHAARVAAVVGDMLAELHGALASLELDALGVPPLAWPPRGEELRRRARFAPDTAAAIALCARWDALAAAPHRREDVLLHGDVDLHNLGFDPATGLPVSLFDFHDAGRGARANDAKALPAYGEAFAMQVLERYARASGHALGITDVRVAHAATAIAGLHPGATEDEKRRVSDAIAAC